MADARDRKQDVLFWLLFAGVLAGIYFLIWEDHLSEQKVNRDFTERVKVWILSGSLVLVGLRWAWHHWIEPLGGSLAFLSRRLLAVLLVTLCVASVANYGRFGTKVLLERVDSYDLIHYYVGARYFDELGYFGLYPAMILADREKGGPFFVPSPTTYLAEGPAGYQTRPFEEAYVAGEEVKKRFTPERWEAFCHDFVLLQRQYTGLTREYWWQMVNDHGFNGTPAWVGYAAPIAKAVPVESVKVVGYLDVGLLVAAVAACWWAFGGWSTGLLVVFLTTSYSTRWPTISWALLRYDYVAAMLLATALVRKGRPLLAGILAGHAAAARLFPLVWLFGPGVQGFWKLVKERRLDRFWLLFAVGCSAWLLALQLNVVAQWGFEPIVTHWHSMTDHVQPENLSSRREGLDIALAYRGEVDAPWSLERIQRVDAQKPVARVVGLLLVLALGLAVRRADRAESFALGLVPFFCLTTASYYYLVVRGPLVAVHGAEPGKGRHAVGMAILLGSDLFCNYAQQHLGGNRIFLIGWLGWILAFYCLFAIVSLALEDWKATRPRPPLPETPWPASSPATS